jgi:hypothetical protein
MVLILAARGTVLLLQVNTPAANGRLERRILFAAVLWCFALAMLGLKEPFRTHYSGMTDQMCRPA